MEARLERIRELINEKERIEGELEGLISGSPVKAAKRKCSHCGSESHTARNCPEKQENASE